MKTACCRPSSWYLWKLPVCNVSPHWAIAYQILKSCNITVPTLSSSMCRKSIFGFNYFSAHKHTAIHHSRRLLCRALCQHQVGHNWGLYSKIWDGFSLFLFWQTYCKFTIFWAGSVHWILRLQIIRSRLQHKFWQKSVSCYQANPILKYGFQKKISFCSRCSSFLSPTFVEIKNSFTRTLLTFNSKNFGIICYRKNTDQNESIICFIAL